MEKILIVSHGNLAQELCKACEMITNTTLSFHQIASILGYEHDSAFFQTFKRVKGIRPSEYK